MEQTPDAQPSQVTAEQTPDAQPGQVGTKQSSHDIKLLIAYILSGAQVINLAYVLFTLFYSTADVFSAASTAFLIMIPIALVSIIFALTAKVKSAAKGFCIAINACAPFVIATALVAGFAIGFRSLP